MEKKLNYKEIINSPFVVVWNEKEEYQIVIGQNVISNKKFARLEDAIKYINKKPWELILNASLYFCDKVNEMREKQNKTE